MPLKPLRVSPDLTGGPFLFDASLTPALQPVSLDQLVLIVRSYYETWLITGDDLVDQFKVGLYSPREPITPAEGHWEHGGLIPGEVKPPTMLSVRRWADPHFERRSAEELQDGMELEQRFV